MSESLHGKKIAILATDGFEQSELFEPKKMLEQAGAETEVISLKSGDIKGWNVKNWGDSIRVDKTVSEARATEYDGLVLPGGVISPDHLRMDTKAMAFVEDFVATGRPIGAICHGPWSLVEVGAVEGRIFTSWPSLKTDIENAGGTWVDKEVVEDGQFVSSRKPDDIPAFGKTLIEHLSRAKGRKAA